MDNTTSGMQIEAATITSFFKTRKILTRIVGGFASPTMYVYRLEMAASQKFDAVTQALDDLQRVIYSSRITHGVIQRNDPRQRVVCRVSPQPLVLEVNRPTPQLLELPAVQWQPTRFTALAGVAYPTRQGQPIVWNLADPGQPHALIAGTSGSGKSNLELAIAITLATGTSPEELSLFIVDGGNSTLQLLSKLKHTVAFAGDADGALRLVRNVVAIVMDRKRRSETSGTHRVLLIVDELANLLAVMDRDTSKALQKDLAVVAAEGRKFGVHMAACTQKPLSEVTGSLTKSNMAVRFVGLMVGWQDAQTAADMPGTGAERLAGNGDFIYRNGPLVQRFQAPLVHPLTSIIAANNVWRSVDPAQIHQYLLSLIDEQLADRDEDDDAGRQPTAVTVASIPPALLPVFEQYTAADGTLARGGTVAALRALFGDEAPTAGKRYQLEAKRVVDWHAKYFTSLHFTSPTSQPSTSSRTSVLAVGSEVKQDGQVWY